MCRNMYIEAGGVGVVLGSVFLALGGIRVSRPLHLESEGLRSSWRSRARWEDSWDGDGHRR